MPGFVLPLACLALGAWGISVLLNTSLERTLPQTCFGIVLGMYVYVRAANGALHASVAVTMGCLGLVAVAAG